MSPYPCSGWYEVCEEGVKVKLVKGVVGEDGVSCSFTELSQEIRSMDSALWGGPFAWDCVVLGMALDPV